MTGLTPWAEVRDSRFATDEQRELLAAARRELDAEIAAHARTLRDLRRARELTQAQLAKSLDVTQAQVSRVEAQADLYLSTLRSYVEALGGELQLRVVFPDGAWADVVVGETSASPGDSVTLVELVGVADGVVHVVPHPKGWAVKRPGASRAVAVLRTKQEAVRRATRLVRGRGDGEVLVREGTSASVAAKRRKRRAAG